MTDTEIHDPELSDLLPLAHKHREGVQIGVIWAHLWTNRSKITEYRVPMYDGWWYLAKDMARLIGWGVHHDPIPEGWDHHGERGWILVAFNQEGVHDGVTDEECSDNPHRPGGRYLSSESFFTDIGVEAVESSYRRGWNDAIASTEEKEDG